MAEEIEKKYLVTDGWQTAPFVDSKSLVQWYIVSEIEKSVRVRISDDEAYLTIKAKADEIAGIAVRQEYEWQIPKDDAIAMLALAIEEPIYKTRHILPMGNHKWEVDEFHGKNKGLVVAEIELTDPNETFSKPDWLGQDVSTDPKYFNACLARKPFSTWEN